MCRQTLKHMNMQLSVRHGYSTVAHEPHEPIRSIVRVVMAHCNLARQRYQKWTSPLVARIPLALVSLPLEGGVPKGERQMTASFGLLIT